MPVLDFHMSTPQNSFLYSNMEPLKPVEATTSQLECASANSQEVILIFNADNGSRATNISNNKSIEERTSLDENMIGNNNNMKNIHPNSNLIYGENQNLIEDSARTGQSDNSIENGDDKSETTRTDSRATTRFKWTKEKSQVAMNLVKHGCKPKLVSVAVGCSLRTAQKFVETVTPKIEGESFKNYEIRRRGRKSKDVNQRLNAIREVLSKDESKTQVEIAADLKVSNTTVCRDLKRIGTPWKKKRKRTISNDNEHDESVGNASDPNPGVLKQDPGLEN